MSLDDLRADLARNTKHAVAGVLDPATRDHLASYLWPWLEALVEVVEEIDDAVAEVVHQQEDYLQPETAAVFAAVISSSLDLVSRLRAARPGDAETTQLALAHEQLCEHAVGVLSEITLMSDDDTDDENDDQIEEGTDDAARR